MSGCLDPGAWLGVKPPMQNHIRIFSYLEYVSSNFGSLTLNFFIHVADDSKVVLFSQKNNFLFYYFSIII